jgi:hypothetical protein
MYTLAPEPNAERTILSRSEDGGKSFVYRELPFRALDAVISPQADALVYALSETGAPVRVSGNGGDTFAS